VRSLFGYAHRCGYLRNGFNVSVAVRPKPATQATDRSLSAGEVARLHRAAKTSQEKLIVKTPVSLASPACNSPAGPFPRETSRRAPATAGSFTRASAQANSAASKKKT